MIEATQSDDTSKVSDVTFNVCNPPVQVSTVPAYRTLYANQAADIQSLVVGAVDQTVNWAITQKPTDGDGAAGGHHCTRYGIHCFGTGTVTLTATSNADSRKTATTTIYVTGHKMPYRVTPNQTEPVDCSVDPRLLGRVYEVGPSQTYKTLASVPFPTMPAGSTVRLHNEDTTGLHPTEFHEYVQISQQATADQPFRMCGVPDSAGNLPVIDGTNATGRNDTDSGAIGRVW